jgi:hypothetical protein
MIPYGHVLCPKKIGNAKSVHDQEIVGGFTDRCLQRRAILADSDFRYFCQHT